MNKAMNNNMNRTVKTKSLADYPIEMYQSLWWKIISKVKLSFLQLLMNRKRQGKKIMHILFYLAQQKHWVTYLNIPGRWNLKAKKAFNSKQTRMKVIHEHSHESCADFCNTEWLNRALEVLQENNIYPLYFSAAVRKIFQMGHGKSRNIIGRANCAKTFRLLTWALVWYIL